MAKPVIPLTDTKIAAAKAKNQNYYLYDGEGLILLVRKSGTKSWQYKFKRPNGKDGRMTLGNYPALTLKAARTKRLELATLLANGIDPINAQQEARQQTQAAELENALTVEKVAYEWHAAYAASNRGWKYPKAELNRLKNHLLPEKLPSPDGEIDNPLLKKPISEVKSRDLLPAFEAMDKKGVSTTLERVRGMAIKMFDYAIQKNYIDHNPAYTLKNAVLNAPSETYHRPALPLERVPELLQRVDAYKGFTVTRLCLLLALHTALRSSELRFARWSEIRLDRKIWVIPAVREAVTGVKFSERGTKMGGRNGYIHLVPLSEQVIKFLTELKEFSGDHTFLFPIQGGGAGCLSESTINQALKRMGYRTNTRPNEQGMIGEVSLHGFRTMARSAVEDAKLFSYEAIRAQLSHRFKDGREDELDSIYGRMANHLDERFKLMRWWSDWLDANHAEYIRPFKYAHPDQAEPDADLRMLFDDL